MNFVITFVAIVTSSLTLRYGSSFVDATPADDPGAGGHKGLVRVTTIEDKPYVFKKPNHSVPPKKDDYDGFIPELLNRLASELKFDYTIGVVPDGKYGGKTSNGQWFGMIGEIVSGNADLAAAALTVSEPRKEVVDFTRPFMKFDSAILLKKPDNTTSSPSIKSLADLADQNVISYGVIRGGVTESYFSQNNDGNPLYQRMWQHMSANSGTGVSDAKEGLRRVRESHGGRPYAFITEGSTADFWVNQQPCDIISIPVKMGERSYALATKKNWSMRDDIDAALNRMDKSEELTQLRNKWWNSGVCTSGASGSRVLGGDVTAAGIRLVLQLLAAVLVIVVPTSLSRSLHGF